MEHSLTFPDKWDESNVKGLNPCSNGTLSDKPIGHLNARQVLCLNPCSNGTLSDFLYSRPKVFGNRLNPCSNGTLSDKLKESALDFSCFLIPGHNPVSVRELVPSGRNFRKCMRNYSSFQIKTIVYLLNLLKSNGLHFRK